MRLLALPLAGVAMAAALTMPTAAQAAERDHSTVEISRIWYDSPGPDYRSPTSLNAEWVAITNRTRRTVDLRGWELSDRGGHTYEFESTRLAPRATVYVRTGSGRDSLTYKYWGMRNYVWNNDTDSAKVVDGRGRFVDSCSYRHPRRGQSFVNC